MIQLRNTCRLGALIAVALVAAGCASNPSSGTAQKGGYYVVNPDNQVYMDGHGHCWHVKGADKTATDMRAACGDQVATGEKDSDGDGVPDSRDRCPNTPHGTRVDADGCPIEKQAPIVLKGVTFAFDSAELTPGARSRLDNVVDALKASPDMSFRIDGYTDSIGTEAYNRKLSQRRMDSVREYLLGHGIDAGRITAAEGHGESDPVASNATAAGRAQNRRVALSVTGQ